MSALRCRPVALLLLVLILGACTTWRPSTIGPRQLIEEERPRVVRVTGPDSVQRVVRNPRIEDGAIVMDAECRRSQSPRGGYICPTETILTLEDVTGIDVRRVAFGRTTLFLLVTTTALAAAIGSAAWSN